MVISIFLNECIFKKINLKKTAPNYHLPYYHLNLKIVAFILKPILSEFLQPACIIKHLLLPLKITGTILQHSLNI